MFVMAKSMIQNFGMYSQHLNLSFQSINNKKVTSELYPILTILYPMVSELYRYKQ